jgi:hypothetical protein
MIIVEGLMLGLLGSAHCAGMCGPIAIAMPLKNGAWFARITGALLYNLGRTITYALLGLIFGLAGMGLSMGGVQQWVSIIMGILMILSVILPVLFGRISVFDRLIGKIAGYFTGYFKRIFSWHSYFSLLVIGILNGFLPCGLVYIALAGALATADWISGIFYMALFGLGTIPMLLVLNLAGNVLSQYMRTLFRKIIPYFIILIGILFILRGMNLGIKYISPKLVKESTTRVECCH